MHAKIQGAYKQSRFSLTDFNRKRERQREHRRISPLEHLVNGIITNMHLHEQRLKQTCGADKYTPCLRKNCTKLFLSELRQLFINFNNFWQVDEKTADIICDINIFHLPSLMPSQYLVKQKSAIFYITLK